MNLKNAQKQKFRKYLWTHRLLSPEDELQQNGEENDDNRDEDTNCEICLFLSLLKQVLQVDFTKYKVTFEKTNISINFHCQILLTKTLILCSPKNGRSAIL